jgi:hypothetical protein
VDLLSKLLTFEPAQRLTATQALEHPFFSAYHDLDDEPESPEKFDRWREVERLETLEQFRGSLLKEVLEFREEVRSIGAEAAASMANGDSITPEARDPSPPTLPSDPTPLPTPAPEHPELSHEENGNVTSVPFPGSPDERPDDIAGQIPTSSMLSKFTDPYQTYARRTSLYSERRDSILNAAAAALANARLGHGEQPSSQSRLGEGAMNDGMQASYIVPARSRVTSVDEAALMGHGYGHPQLLRQLSTMSTNNPQGITRDGPLALGGNDLERSAAADALPSTAPSEWSKKDKTAMSS